MKSFEIRSAFLRYFQQQGHALVPSSILVPEDDPTLLFVNAGMNQFKSLFLGHEQRDYQRAVTAQRCVRAGGKHNDLENVGYTARHHTFFEMLGNFSFGDYFKTQAIPYAWAFLTEVLHIPAARLWITVYAEDEESYRIWQQDIGIPAERIIRIGDNKGAPYASDNFWTMGDTGPCGPCTEIFYDHGPDIAGGPPGSPEEDGDRFVEIWNIVFMQFNRQSDGTMEALPAPSVDTGMGLERVAAVLQGVHSNYEIDLFQTLLASVATCLHLSSTDDPSVRVIADHIRSCAFLLADGVIPSHEGRGYVLRRIIRRAVRHGHKLGVTEPFFYQLVQTVIDVMGDAGQTVAAQQQAIEQTLLKEEQQFARTLNSGMRMLEQALANLQGNEIPGSVIFTLYDTYGFPTDLTNDIAREKGLTLDIQGFEQHMQQQRDRARSANKFALSDTQEVAVSGKADFLGYADSQCQGQVQALWVDGQSVEQMHIDQEGIIVLDRTVFYGESGGQVGDAGTLSAENLHIVVSDTQKQGEQYLHYGKISTGVLSVGDALTGRIDTVKRQATAANHSATHLLHAALRDNLGAHVQQKGSLVNAQGLRFDFSHGEPLTVDEIESLENIVNAHIRANTPVLTELCDQETAKEKGAMALFTEKYADQVRVLTMGEAAFSVELCGGTHVQHTGDIGTFVIVSEAGIAAGVRRIEARTGVQAERFLREHRQNLTQVAALMNSSPNTVLHSVQALLTHNRDLERELMQLKQHKALEDSRALLLQTETVSGIKVLAAQMDWVEPKTLRSIVDWLKGQLGRGIVVIAAAQGDKVVLAAGVTSDLTPHFKAGALLKQIALQVGGKGGGRDDFAQGGGSKPEQLPNALAQVQDWVETIAQPLK